MHIIYKHDNTHVWIHLNRCHIRHNVFVVLQAYIITPTSHPKGFDLSQIAQAMKFAQQHGQTKGCQDQTIRYAQQHQRA